MTELLRCMGSRLVLVLDGESVCRAVMQTTVDVELKSYGLICKPDVVPLRLPSSSLRSFLFRVILQLFVSHVPSYYYLDLASHIQHHQTRNDDT